MSNPFAPATNKPARHEGRKPAVSGPAEYDEAGIPVGTAVQILDWAGDDAEKATAALERERAAERPRTSLIERLEAAQRRAEKAEDEESENGESTSSDE
jgi:hypothetical protein